MAWYDTGTVNVTNGSTTVVGVGTNFIAGAQVGEGFYGPDGGLYEIQAIVSATSLTLADAYLGSNQTGQAYKIVPTQSLVAALATQVSTLISDFQGVVDEAGSGKFADGTAASAGITFTLDQDTGIFRPAANQIGFTTAGVQRALVSNTGVDVTGNAQISGNLTVDTSTLHVDSLNNRVGIGTASPATLLHLSANNAGITTAGTGNTKLRFEDTDPTKIGSQVTGTIDWYTNDADATGVQAWITGDSTNVGAGSLAFGTGVAGATEERMRIDSSGNLLVGKTVTNDATSGCEQNPNGYQFLTRDSGTPLYVRRNTNDGSFIDFRKDTAVVGSIGTFNGDLVLGTGLAAIRMSDGGASLNAHRMDTNNSHDAQTSLGQSNVRWKDLYLSGGVVFGTGGPAPITSNTLDDYEEGTWTPTYSTTATNFTSVTYNTTFTYGTYIKIGNTVVARGYIRTEAITVGSAGGALRIGGIPFVSSAGINSVTDVRSRGSCTGDNFAASAPSLLASDNGSGYFLLYSQNAIGSGTSYGVVPAVSAMSTATAANTCTFTITYVTDA